MSRNSCMIRDTLSLYGLEAARIEWTPIGRASEMCGHSGGWEVWLDEQSEDRLRAKLHMAASPITGYNTPQVIDEIHWMMRPDNR